MAGFARKQRLPWALDLLFLPLDCQVCEAPVGTEPICESCRAELIGASGPSCRRCALQIGPWGDVDKGCSECRGRPLGFDAAVALGPYQGPIRDLCLRLKREKDAWLAPWLIDVLIEAQGERLAGERADFVAPVPLHWWRRMSRGYDQADALASALAERLRLPVARPLRRVVRTEKLATLGRTERAQRMRGVFRSRPDRSLTGRTALLVDDILTTGATCGEAARALKRAGVKRVVAAVLARAEGRP